MKNIDFTSKATDIRVGDTVDMVSRYGQMLVTEVTKDEKNNRIIAMGIDTAHIGIDAVARPKYVVRYFPTNTATITRSAELSDKSLQCLFIDSISAISYWADITVCAEDAAENITSMQITDREHEDRGYTINAGTYRLGAEFILSGGSNYAGNGSKDALKKLHLALLTDLDDGDYDAFDADALVQLGLFGEIRYG